MFSTATGAIALAVVLAIEILSLLAMVAVILLFLRTEHREAEFFSSVASEDPWYTKLPIRLWVYVAATVGIGVVTTALFVLQPHLL